MDTICTYDGDRDQTLIAYLYDDIDPALRSSFEAHVAGCAACRRDLDEFGAVRARLGEWHPPEPVGRAVRNAAIAVSASSGRFLSWRTMPAWAQVAAAMLFLGVSTAVANLDVTYGADGLSIRTGWMRPVAVATARPASSGEAVPAGRVASEPASEPIVAAADPAPWLADLARLERRLNEIRATAAPATTRAAARSTVDEEALFGRVRALVDESEKRQQRELALRIATADSNARIRRIADLRNIERNLAVTDLDMKRLYRVTNDLAVRVSQAR